jgi:regulator of protease activity HflC (stomatin/prohibitin superfamily)
VQELARYLPYIIPVGFVLLILFMGLKVVNEYERGIVFRLGRVTPKNFKGPGLRFIIPFIDRLVKVDLRTVTRDVPPQDVITRDNISVKVNAVIFSRVIDPAKAILQVESYGYATSQLAQTTLRSVIGHVELDELLTNREAVNAKLQEILDRQTDPWGIKVSAVEVKHVDLPPEMVRAIARQAEAERERRAKVIHAEGEFQAAQKLADAAKIVSEHPAALQLRYLQTLVEVAAENNSTTLFPIPIDLIKSFLESKKTA